MVWVCFNSFLAILDFLNFCAPVHTPSKVWIDSGVCSSDEVNSGTVRPQYLLGWWPEGDRVGEFCVEGWLGWLWWALVVFIPLARSSLRCYTLGVFLLEEAMCLGFLASFLNPSPVFGLLFAPSYPITAHLPPPCGDVTGTQYEDPGRVGPR